MVMTKFWSRGPGARCTAELPEPSTADRRKGMVRMPSRFVPTVSSNASAAFPPAAYQAQRQHEALQNLYSLDLDF